MKRFWFYKRFLTDVRAAPSELQDELLWNIITYGSERKVAFVNPIAESYFWSIKSSMDTIERKYKKAVNGGKKGGKPLKIKPDDKELIEELHYMEIRNYSAQEIADHFGVSLSTAYRLVKRYPIPQELLDKVNSGFTYEVGLHIMKGQNEYEFGGHRIKQDGKPLSIDELKEMAQRRHIRENDTLFHADTQSSRAYRAYKKREERNRWLDGKKS